MAKLVLIDGHSILNRAFYGVPDLTNAQGVHTNAIYGFLNIMFKIIDEEKPEHLIVAFDMSAPTFRHKMFAEYKGTRKPMPEELRQQVPLIKEVLEAMGIEIVQKEGYEADDILGTIAKHSEKNGLDVSIVSGDRDILQIATEHIMIRIPKTKKGVTEIENYNACDVEALYGVTPAEFIDMKALMGDSSDNIPGAPGIGEKTAGAIIQKFGSVENAYNHIDEVTPNRARNSLADNYDQVLLSKKLATIDIDAPVEYDVDSATLDNMFSDKAYEMFKRYNFKSLLKKFDAATTTREPEIFDKFRTIEDFGEVEEYFAGADFGGCIGLKLLYEDGCVSGAALAHEDNSVCYIPVQGFVTEDYLKAKITDMAAVCDCIAGLNIKSVLPAIDRQVYPKLIDAGLGAYLLNPLKESYSYDELARDYLNMLLPNRNELTGRMSYAEASMVKSEELARLACMEAYCVRHAWNVISVKLDEVQMKHLFDDIEMPLVFVLYDMECEGIMVDSKGLKEYGDKLATRITELENTIYELAGTKFNINSPKQLGTVLFEDMKLPSGKKTKSGYSTAADVLEKLAPEYPIVAKILEYRQLTKLKSTYADGLAVYIREDGRIHGHFNQTITATGRISSTEPNLQNIPVRMEIGRQIRKVFVPKPGCVFLDADYSQIELRILAHMSQDDKLIAAYNTAQDIHAITASQVFHVPLDEVTRTQRSNAKAVNFGIIYGISSFGLSQDLSISRKEASEYIEQYFATYPHIKEFIDGLVASAKKNGYSTTMFGRRRPVPELNSSNFMQRQFGERIAMNSPIQGSAADIIKIAMINVSRALKDNNLKSKMILQVHDELLIETYEDEEDAVRQILIDNMTNAASLRVPLEVDVKEGHDWLEAH